ncbi:hypothetical protein K9857_01300 [Pseudomonas sp. REP124]|uniref:hypothetical protein n=1 Tax=Pseudomonas sp. REP124 TaxID=2875731 RepID=UPI001CC96127|nr:hypothetical protein [Pseudomonas sp. REP124]MBZ9780189.1 hypothetical protein [Pseudomonas sp. REP124]
MNASLTFCTRMKPPLIFNSAKKYYVCPQQLEGPNTGVLRIIEQQRTYANVPPDAICRVAIAVSTPRNGTRIQCETAPWEFTWNNGRQSREAQRIMPFSNDLH